MSLSSGKISNYIGQAKDEKQLNNYLIMIDKDISNIFSYLNTIAPLIGTLTANLETNTALDFTYIPVMSANPTATPTNYTGHTAITFSTSNSNFYVFNTSNNNWRTVNLT